jgi:hypothetical protein
MTDKWLESLLQKSAPARSLAKTTNVVSADILLHASVFDSHDDQDVLIAEKIFSIHGDADASGPDSPVDVILKARNDALLKGFVGEASWDEPLTKTLPTLSLEKSKARFEKVRAAIEKVFGKDSDEYTEALAIAKRALDEVRAEIILGRELPHEEEL